MEIQRAYHPFLLVHWIVCLIQNHPHFVFCTRHQIQKFTTVSYGSWPVFQCHSCLEGCAGKLIPIGSHGRLSVFIILVYRM